MLTVIYQDSSTRVLGASVIRTADGFVWSQSTKSFIQAGDPSSIAKLQRVQYSPLMGLLVGQLADVPDVHNDNELVIVIHDTADNSRVGDPIPVNADVKRPTLVVSPAFVLSSS